MAQERVGEEVGAKIMRVFNIKNLSHAFADKSLFNDTELMVASSDHIGLVGPNGCGKSTFLKILIGEVVPDAYSIDISPDLKIGVLDQFAHIGAGFTVLTYVQSVFEPLYVLEKQMMDLYEQLPNLTETHMEKALNRAQAIQETLTEKEFYQINKKIDNVLSGLGFAEEDRNKTVPLLSGGMKTKLILAKLLLGDNDILILDEPTNFLDMDYIQWLGDYLCRLKCAFIVISHDRAFLNKISNKTVEIANRVFKVYNGNYDIYVKEKERLEAVQLQQHTAQAKYIERSEEYVQTFLFANESGSGKTKATWLKRMLETIKRIEKPDEIIKPKFAFLHLKGASGTVMALTSVEVGYGGSPILPPISLTVKKGDKIVFKGYNGVGKTTLLKSIYGDLPIISGKITFGENIKTVFLKQEEDYENNFAPGELLQKNVRFYKIDGSEVKKPKKSKNEDMMVIQFAKLYYPDKPQKELQAALLSCGLKEIHFYNRVRSLSGGEMTKLRLCLAMMNPVNVIILDEPTNHLDVYSKEVLMHALDSFEGTVLMTTHDINADVSWAGAVINIGELLV
jgi:ATPase subunit of ABC transporter with duplicated ATPase domains